jgi:hypothetical protein
MGKDYSEMGFAELEKEQSAWIAVMQQPTGPGTASNAARQAAQARLGLVEAWIARRSLGV